MKSEPDRALLGNVMTDEPYRRFLILSSPRSGTHMLQTSLARHPNLVCLPEMFNPDWIQGAPFDADTPESEILEEHIFCAYPPGVRAVGFALHRSGARFGNWPTLWERLVADRELHVISLRRHNMLRRYLSFRIMTEPQTDPPAPKTIRPEELRAEFERHEKEIADFDRRFEGHPLLPLSYEELCSDYDTSVHRAQSFLGVAIRPLAPATEHYPPRPLREAIVNFDELAKAFASTRWAWCFYTAPTFSATSAVSF